MDRKAKAFGETGFGEMGLGKTGFGETGRHRQNSYTNSGIRRQAG